MAQNAKERYVEFVAIAAKRKLGHGERLELTLVLNGVGKSLDEFEADVLRAKAFLADVARSTDWAASSRQEVLAGRTRLCATRTRSDRLAYKLLTSFLIAIY